MKIDEIIQYVAQTQSLMGILSCFEFSQEKMRTEESIIPLLSKIMSNTLKTCDKYALLEIIKQWLVIQNRNCEDCAHKVSAGEFSCCELWECEYKPKDEKRGDSNGET